MIAERFAKALERKGITRKEFAEMSNYSEAAISRWINGHRAMSIKCLKKVCKLLDVSADWLIGLTDKEDFDD